MTTITTSISSFTKNPLLAPSRIQEWWLPKAGNILLTLFIVIAIVKMPFYQAFIYLFPAILTIAGIGAFGHLVNDWFDIAIDKKAGKKNRMANLSVFKRILVLLLFLTIALIPWLVLPWDENSLWLLGGEFTLLILYAIPPIRFKERGLLGVLADGLYAYAIPSILAAYTFFLIAGDIPDIVFLGLLFAWQFFLGCHNILIHQVEDYENDLLAGIRTFPVIWSTKAATKLTILGVLIFELLFFVTLVLYISVTYFSGYFLLPFLFLWLKYWPIFSVASLKVLARLDNTVDLQATNLDYYKFLVFWNLFWCAWVTPLFWIMLILTLNIIPQVNEFTRKIIKALKRLYNVCYYQLGHWVNLSIYYFRRYVKREDDKTARREHYVPPEEVEALEKLNDIPVIGIVNRNESKYTETFVNQHLMHLPYIKHFFFGGDSYTPQYVSYHGKDWVAGFLPNWINRVKISWWSKDYLLKIAFQHELLTNLSLIHI